MAALEAGWRRVAAVVAGIWVVWAIIVTIAIGGLEPFVLIFAIVPLLAWAATRWRPGKVTYTIFGVLGLLVILLNLPFLVEDLAHPESAFGFNTTTLPIIAALLMVLVGVAAWRNLSDKAATRSLVVFGGLFVLGLIVSVVLALGLEDDTAAEGDVSVVAEDVEFAPAEISASTGSVGVFVKNEDPVRHTFTIDELDVDLELPASTARRIEFQAPAGTYEFFCSVPGHENMKGTLTVGG